jgi:hypothetical protein
MHQGEAVLDLIYLLDHVCVMHEVVAAAMYNVYMQARVFYVLDYMFS